MFHRIEEDLKKGKVVIVCDDENRENEGDFIALAEYITPETINFMITHTWSRLCTDYGRVRRTSTIRTNGIS